MSLIIKLGNILTQDDTFSTQEIDSKLIGEYSAIVCLNTVVPDDAEIYFDGAGTRFPLFPYVLIQHKIFNRINLRFPATLTETDVTITKNVPFTFLLFGPDEIPFVPQFVPRINRLAFTISNANERRFLNVKIQRCKIGLESNVGSDQPITITNEMGGGNANEIFYKTIFDTAGEEPQKAARIEIDHVHGLSFKGDESGSKSYKVNLEFVQ